MNLRNTKRIAIVLSGLFLGAILLDACASSKPGFSTGNKKKGKKVKSSGKMYR